MNLKDDRPAILLSQNEMQYIMGLLGAQSLVGIDASLLTGAAPEEGRRSLLSRGLVQAGQPGENNRIRGDVLHLAIPVLFPERALVVVRTIPKVGTQTLIFLNRDKTTVLHSMPQNDMHRLINLETPVDGIRTLTEWFPFQGYFGSSVNVIIPSGNLDRFKNYAETDQDQLALKAIEVVPMPLEEKMLFLRTIKEPTVSGSFAMFTIIGNSISSAESLAIIANQSVAWAITFPDGNLQKNAYRVRRTGEDLPPIFRNMFAWLGNVQID
jgi:hypothetical protein